VLSNVLQVVDEDGWGWGRGSRKTARAHVKVKFGNGQFIVNQSNLQTFFSIIHYREWALKPLEVIQGLGKFDVHAYVTGSGHSGEASQKLGVSFSAQLECPILTIPIECFHLSESSGNNDCPFQGSGQLSTGHPTDSRIVHSS